MGKYEVSNRALAIFVTIFICMSLVSTVIVYYKAKQYFQHSPISGESVAGTLNLTVQQVCGNGICAGGETCSSCQADCGICSAGQSSPGGGGGGKGGGSLKTDFIVDKSFVKITLLQGDASENKFTITNIGDLSLFFTIELNNLNEYVKLSELQFQIRPKESKEIRVLADLPSNIKPDIYTANIKIKARNQEKNLPLVLEVNSRKTFFDTQTNVLDEFKIVEPGSDVWGRISVFNFAGLPNEMDIYYAIKDMNNTIINERSDKELVKDGITISRSLNTLNAPLGDYVFYTKVTYLGQAAVSGDFFTIASKEKIEVPKTIKLFNYGLLVLIVLVVLVLLWIWKQHWKLKAVERVYRHKIEKAYKRYLRHTRTDVSKERTKVRLNKQLDTLEDAYKGGYISTEAYNKGKDRINDMLRKMG